MNWWRKLFPKRPVLMIYGIPAFKNGQIDGLGIYQARKKLRGW
jgi:hypothetical protein